MPGAAGVVRRIGLLSSPQIAPTRLELFFATVFAKNPRLARAQ
jgi:hypothetical protein